MPGTFSRCGGVFYKPLERTLYLILLKRTSLHHWSAHVESLVVIEIMDGCRGKSEFEIKKKRSLSYSYERKA